LTQTAAAQSSMLRLRRNIIPDIFRLRRIIHHVTVALPCRGAPALESGVLLEKARQGHAIGAEPAGIVLAFGQAAMETLRRVRPDPPLPVSRQWGPVSSEG
jgi:hypothetical protein